LHDYVSRICDDSIRPTVTQRQFGEGVTSPSVMAGVNVARQGMANQVFFDQTAIRRGFSANQ